MLLAVCLAAIGCRRGPSPIAIDRILVDDVATPWAPVDKETVRAEAQAAFEGSGRFRLNATGEGGRIYRARVSFEIELELADGQNRILARAEVELTPLRGEGTRREGAQVAESLPRGLESGAPPHPGPEAEKVTARLRGRALARAVEGIALQLAASERTGTQLLADLSVEDVRVRDYAVRELAERRNPAAVSALIGRLKDPDRTVVSRTIGALSQLRDPRAVPALIELTRRREEEFVSQVVHVIGDIGGPEAEAYLMTLEAGHPEQRIRTAAGESLKNLRQRPGVQMSTR
jgi:hypothetical protein